ncbi:MAG: PKD domain-containing protein [Flavobacteriales bacterium]|nr:PKD domain-containing protein [Flavobacteriales bacterium]
MKGKLYRLLSVFIFLITFSPAYSTHIVGGSLTYEHLGGSTYRILLKLYRDCTPATGPHADLQTSAAIEIYNANGTFNASVTLNRIQLTTVPLNLDTCVADPGICVEEGLYAGIVNNLPPVAGGYHLYFETCCRNSSIVNLNNPLNAGEGFYCRISDNTMLLTNSSPQWVNFPPVFVCQGQPLDFDHSATDADGDSLVYSFYNPLSDIDYLTPNDLTFTAGVPNFVYVNYNPGYGVNNPLGGANLTISSGGIVDGIPSNIGQYVVGVRCDEWRDGILIGSVYRDFQFNVVVCPPPALAGIGPVNGCAGNAIQFNNTSSITANGFVWDFGDGSPTSTQTNPSHTYPGIGTYTVQLIAQYGTPCADTAYRTFPIAWSNADFNNPDSVCISSPASFSNTSTASANNTVNSWTWNFGDGSPTSGLPNPTHTFASGGLYNVQLIINSSSGCRDTINHPVFVQSLPSVNVGPDTSACNNNPLVSLNGTVNNASGGLWLNGNGTFNPNSSTLVTDYTPSAAEVSAGSMFLVLSSTGNGLCPTAVDTLHIVFVDGPDVNAGADIQVCKDTSGVPLNGTVQFAGGGTWSSSGSGTFSPNANTLNATYIPSAADTAAGAVTLYLTATNVGNCITTTDTVEVGFYNPPTALIMNNDTACSGDPIPLLVNVTTGQGIWTTLGSGIFTPDSLVGSYYHPGANDISNGTVTLIFTSINNGGCQAAKDTIDVAIIPSPVPAFSFTEPCFGITSVFTDGSTAIGGVVGWNWDFGDGQSSTSVNPTHLFAQAGTYNVTLIATSSNGCKDTLTQPVDVHYLPEVGFYSPNPCLNGGTDFTDTSSVVGSTITGWQWNFGDGGTSTVQNPNHLYPGAGSYSVTLIATTAFGCIDSLTQNTNVLPGPNAAYIASSYSVNQFEVVNFTDQSTPAGQIVSWQWNFGDSSAIDLNQNPSHGFNGSGTYSVILVVEDGNGCYDTTKSDIIVFLPPDIPNAFSPNGDGNNDFLYIYGGPFKELEYRIYNNWGELIFESTDIQQCGPYVCLGWDGTYKNVPQPMSVYVYQVRAVTEDGVEHVITGDVTLLR